MYASLSYSIYIVVMQRFDSHVNSVRYITSFEDSKKCCYSFVLKFKLSRN